jgi:hypothetical protein
LIEDLRTGGGEAGIDEAVLKSVHSEIVEGSIPVKNSPTDMETSGAGGENILVFITHIAEAVANKVYDEVVQCSILVKGLLGNIEQVVGPQYPVNPWS